MGAHLTTEHETNGLPMKDGQVIVFHSSTKWRIHFEASKQASKLLSCCGACPEFAEKYTDVDFIQNDDDELHDVAEEFGVQFMPGFMLLKIGKVADKVVGAKGKTSKRRLRNTDSKSDQ